MSNDKIKGIYKITNTANGQVYIGESNDIHKRWEEHKKDLQNNNHHSYKLQNDFNIYNESDFQFEILEILDVTGLTTYQVQMGLILSEYKYIHKLNTIDNGYNIENTVMEVLSGNKVIVSSHIDRPYIYKKLIELKANEIADKYKTENVTYIYNLDEVGKNSYYRNTYDLMKFLKKIEVISYPSSSYKKAKINLYYQNIGLFDNSTNSIMVSENGKQFITEVISVENTYINELRKIAEFKPKTN